MLQIVSAQLENGTPVNGFFCVPMNPFEPYGKQVYVDSDGFKPVEVVFAEVAAVVVQKLPEIEVVLEQPAPAKTWMGAIWDFSAQVASDAVPVMKKIMVDAVKDAAKENGKEIAAGILKGYTEDGMDGALGAVKAGAQRVAEDAKAKATEKARKKATNVVNNVLGNF